MQYLVIHYRHVHPSAFHPRNFSIWYRYTSTLWYERSFFPLDFIRLTCSPTRFSRLFFPISTFPLSLLFLIPWHPNFKIVIWIFLVNYIIIFNTNAKKFKNYSCKLSFNLFNNVKFIGILNISIFPPEKGEKNFKILKLRFE